MALKIIAAVAANGVIGKNNGLVWHLQSDLRRFKETTMGHTVAMGSKTFRSILDRLHRPLPGRTSLVLSRNGVDDCSPDVEIVQWWQSIVKRSENQDIFVIGGASLYTLALPYASELHLTRVHADVDGDTFFPEWNPLEWERIFHEGHVRDEGNQFDFTFEIYRRI